MSERLNILHEVGMAMLGDGQQLADSLSNERNGCFEFCDGSPNEQLRPKQIAIFQMMADILEAGDGAAQADIDALMERAREYGAISGAVDAVCRLSCPGGYSLFSEGEELHNDEGAPIIRQCPIKAQLADVVINFTLPAEN